MWNKKNNKSEYKLFFFSEIGMYPLYSIHCNYSNELNNFILKSEMANQKSKSG